MTTGPLLIVDDSNNIRLTVSKALETFGLPIEATAYAEDALLRLGRGEYSAVLLDLELVGMGGLEMLRRMRALRPNVPVLVITADGSAETEAEARRLGASDFVLKPFSPKEIRERVARLLAAASDVAP